MNLIMLPNKEDDWSDLELGKKMPIKFPASSYKFMVNEIDGIGKCKTHSLYSPMREFNSQEQAVRVAQDFLNDLIVEREPTVEELVDEDLLGRIMRGEEIDINLDEFAVIEPLKQSAQAESTLAIKAEDINSPGSTTVPKISQAMSRRDLIRGKFLRS